MSHLIKDPVFIAFAFCVSLLLIVTFYVGPMYVTNETGPPTSPFTMQHLIQSFEISFSITGIVGLGAFIAARREMRKKR